MRALRSTPSSGRRALRREPSITTSPAKKSFWTTSSTAPEKLRRVHEAAGAIKGVHARPENLIARHKMKEKTLATAIPACARIIRQGIEEGVFDTKYPAETAER